MSIHACDLSSLDDFALSARLRALAGAERELQVNFLVHLAELDARMAYAPLGFSSLWDYCTRGLHLREGATWRRICAMRLLRRFPQLEHPLRDGRLCLTTLCQLKPVLTEANLDVLVGLASYKSRAHVDGIVATIKPRRAPPDGLRPVSEVASVESAAYELRAGQPAAGSAEEASGRGRWTAVSADRWSLNVTLDAAGRQQLEELADLLAHKVPDRDLTAVVKLAITYALEKYRKVRGAGAPRRKQEPAVSVALGEPAAAGAGPGSDTADAGLSVKEIERIVWERDGGRCTYVSPDNVRCDCRFMLEFDHIVSRAHGGRTTVENLRLRCRAHNLLHAREVFGEEHMRAAVAEGRATHPGTAASDRPGEALTVTHSPHSPAAACAPPAFASPAIPSASSPSGPAPP